MEDFDDERSDSGLRREAEEVEPPVARGSQLSGLTDAENDDDALVGWVEARLLLAAKSGAANPGRPYTIGQLRRAAREILAKVRVPAAAGEPPAPPFGGRPAYERVLDALRHVELVDPTRLELAASAVMKALFGDHTSNADQRYPRIELPWPRDPEQLEELLLRIPLWSIVAHLVRYRDTEQQQREHLAAMFPDEKVPPLLDHLNRTLRDSRELWRVCVEQERKLAAVERVLEFERGQQMIPAATIRAALGQVAADDLD